MYIAGRARGAERSRRGLRRGQKPYTCRCGPACVVMKGGPTVRVPICPGGVIASSAAICSGESGALIGGAAASTSAACAWLEHLGAIARPWRRLHWSST